MEIRELQNAMLNAETVARGVIAAALYPSGMVGGALVAVDVWELEPGASLAATPGHEEQIVYVLAGEGRLTSGDGGASVHVRPDTAVIISPGERVSLHNAGKSPLRVLVTTPMLVRSSRAAGIAAGGRLSSGETSTIEKSGEASREPGVERAAPPPEPSPQPAGEEDAPPPNIEGMMRRASELRGQPRPERRRPPQPQPAQAEPEKEAQPEPEGEDEEEQSNQMELLVAFDAGTRGSPDSKGEGFGRYMVQAPERKPAIRRVELGDDFTPQQAEYRVLIECLSYVIDRLQTTGRSPQDVQLDIRSNSEQTVNQLLGTMKVKDPNLRRDHAEATSLLDQFAEWRIEWAQPEEILRLFGG